LAGELRKLSPLCRAVMGLGGILYLVGASEIEFVDAFGIRVEFRQGANLAPYFVALQAFCLLVSILDIASGVLDRRQAEATAKSADDAALRVGWPQVKKGSRNSAGILVAKGRISTVNFLLLYLLPIVIGIVSIAVYFFPTLI